MKLYFIRKEHPETMKCFSAWFAAMLLLISCIFPAAAETAEQAAPLDPRDIFSSRDYKTDYDAAEAVNIALSNGPVTITTGGTYVLSGTLKDGSITVDAGKNEKVHLVLAGANIHSTTGAPLYVRQADKVFITTAENTENTLSSDSDFSAAQDENVDAALFSKEDLTLNGQGLLIIRSPGGHGIVSKDSLTITGGSYDITSASHALAGKDDVCIAGGNFSLVSGKDALHAENKDDAALGFLYIQEGTFHIATEGDGLSASSRMQLDGGSFDITSGGGSAAVEKKQSGFGGGPGGFGGWGKSRGGSQTTETQDTVSLKGIKAAGDLRISGGTFHIDSADDAIHSNASVTITGGVFDIATGDDAFHAEENLTITDGVIAVSESYEALEGLHILVSGGQLTLNASDDGINAAGGVDGSGGGGRFGGFGWGGNSDGSITLSGGDLMITAHGDGIDANGTLSITGGRIIVCGPSQGDTTVLDYDVSASISGATFIGTGSSFMAQSFSDAEQGVIAANAGYQEAGAVVTLADAQGRELIRHTPDLDYAIFILSTPDIISGDTYTVTAGTASGNLTAQ